MSGLRANFSRMNASLCSSSRPYIHDSRPSANMFLARWPSFLVAPIDSTAPERQRGHRDGLHDVVGQLVGLQRVGLVADLGEVALGELVGVGDDQPAARQVGDVGLQRRGVHRDEDVGTVARGQDVVVGDLNLERRNAGQRPCWCADLGGVIRLRRKVIAEQRGLGGEPVTGELHAVAGVAGETDDNLLELLPSARTGPVAVRTHDPCLSRIFGRARQSRSRCAPSVLTSIKFAVTLSTD